MDRSRRAIARITLPLLFALFSLVLFADEIHKVETIVVCSHAGTQRWQLRSAMRSLRSDDNYEATRLSLCPYNTGTRGYYPTPYSTA